ncbi:DUF3275 family protein [Paraburkholderia sp. BR14261]
MISLSGTLDVRTIKGSNGPFQVGELTTSVGEFKVKVLEQFEPGAYTGTFLIDKIYPHSYVWYGKVTVEIRARLADAQLDNDEPFSETNQPASSAEPDPADEERTAGTTALARTMKRHRPLRNPQANLASRICPICSAPNWPTRW